MSNERPNAGQGLSSLRNLVQNTQVTEVWFNNKNVTLDGFTFVGCRFDNCTLYISSVHFEMHRCFLDSSNTIYYSSGTAKLIRLFNSRYSWTYEQIPMFAPVKHEDGTITITK